MIKSLLVGVLFTLGISAGVPAWSAPAATLTFTAPTGTVGPIILGTGVTLTVPTGSRYVVL